MKQKEVKKELPEIIKVIFVIAKLAVGFLFPALLVIFFSRGIELTDWQIFGIIFLIVSMIIITLVEENKNKERRFMYTLIPFFVGSILSWKIYELRFGEAIMAYFWLVCFYLVLFMYISGKHKNKKLIEAR